MGASKMTTSKYSKIIAKASMTKDLMPSGIWHFTAFFYPSPGFMVLHLFLYKFNGNYWRHARCYYETKGKWRTHTLLLDVALLF